MSEKDLDYMPQTASEIAEVFAEAKRIFGNLRENHSRGVLLVIASELRKWEWENSEKFAPEEERLRSCLMCGRMKEDALDAGVIG